MDNQEKYAVLVASKEGKRLIHGRDWRWENIIRVVTWTIEDSKEEAEKVAAELLKSQSPSMPKPIVCHTTEVNMYVF